MPIEKHPKKASKNLQLKENLKSGKISVDPSYFQQTNSGMSMAKSEGMAANLISKYGSSFNPSTIHEKGADANKAGNLKGLNQNEARNSSYQVPFSRLRSTVTSLGGSSFKGGLANEAKYLQASELEPLLNPEMEWKLFLADIKSDNWSKQFEACNTLRKVCKFH